MNVRTTRKNFTAALGTAAAPLALRAAASAETFTLRFSSAAPVNSLDSVVALRFASAVQRRSGGQLKMEVYANGQLSTQDAVPQGLSTGVIDFAMISTARLALIVPEYQVFDAPFLFKSPAVAGKVLDGRLGSEFFSMLEPKGIVGLGWGLAGFNHIQTASKVVVAPEDLKGLRMRTTNSAVQSAIFQAMGAIPITIDVSELYTALSSHVVDGLSFPLPAFVAAKFYTIAKHIALTQHILQIEVLAASKRKLEALPASLQKLIRDEGRAAGLVMRHLAEEEETEAVQALKQNGVAFTEVQYPAFRKAVDPVYGYIQSKLGGDLLERVSRASGAR